MDPDKDERVDSPRDPLAFAATVAPNVTAEPMARGSSSLIGLSARSTVLPRLVRSGDGHTTSAAGQRFEPVRLLGKGGLGEVTLVQDRDIERPVALKRLHGDQRSDELVFRFAQEIRTIGQLEHPNIAPVHDVGVDDEGHHYFVMRYVDGETLETTISKLASGDATYHRRYTFERRTELFLGILHAIQYAHAKQIIHRDIKPANIMIGPYGEVVVMDWGIAKKRDDAEIAATPDEADGGPTFQTRVGSLVGTPAYMSPEQATGRTEEIDERSDVYSLSALFYELLTLQHYLPGCNSVPELLSAIVDSGHLQASRVTNPHQSPVPAELNWYLEKGLAKDPRERYQSVTEMIDALHRLLAGDFEVRCPITFMKKVGGNGVRFMDRHPIASMIGGTAVLGLVTFAMIQLVRMIA